jgi:hypothetical protein
MPKPAGMRAAVQPALDFHMDSLPRLPYCRRLAAFVSIGNAIFSHVRPFSPAIAKTAIYSAVSRSVPCNSENTNG